MLVTKARGKIRKMLGGDTQEYRWYESPVYRYTLKKENSELTKEGHCWKWNKNNDAVVYELTNDGWAIATVYPLDGGNMATKALFRAPNTTENVCSVSGVEGVEEEVIGRTEWDITVDVADSTIVDVERTEIRNGEGKSDRMREYLEKPQKVSST